MRWKQILGFVAIAFLAYSLLTNGASVGHFVHNVIHASQSAFGNVSSFFDKSKS